MPIRLAGLLATIAIILYSLLSIDPLQAAPMSENEVPTPLKPWVHWVLQDHPEQACPVFYGSEERQCQWPGKLTLTANGQGARFDQRWEFFTEGWITLPGNRTHWPQEIRLDGETAVVTEQGNAPSLLVSSGKHTIEGIFIWDSLPEALKLPAQTALIDLTVDGTRIPAPRMESNGSLWLKPKGREDRASGDEDRLELRVFRRIVDEIPLLMTVRIELEIAGSSRELTLGPVISPGDKTDRWTAMSLDSPLLARLEPDGRLRIQVRPGSWTLVLTARHQGETVALSPPAAELPWPQEEVWAFEARNHLRLVEVKDVTAIDPQQTGLPDEWRNLPAFLVKQDDTLHLEVKRRGDPDPEPDRLQLQRQLWLDFSGKGYTFLDRISGTMTQGGRLDMSAPATLGLVTINGEQQVITKGEKTQTGVEIRHGRIELEAHGRINAPLRRLPATGWQRGFQQVNTDIHLPPGWRLWHAGGIDNLPSSWLKRWTLLDLFVVLITALATARLWRWRWGLLALATLVLAYHEPDAPRWVWLNILGAVALLRLLPGERWFSRMVHSYREISLITLVLIALPFSINQIRQAIYPQLEHPWQTATTSIHRQVSTLDRAEDLANMPSAPMEAEIVSYRKSVTFGSTASSKQQAVQMSRIDPDAQIQTGPGLPQWSWTRIHMGWNGPVEQGQNLKLYLCPPWLTSLLNLVRVTLLIALGAFLLIITRSKKNASSKGAPTMPPLAAFLFFCLAMSHSTAWAAGDGFPPDKMLKKLEERLTAPAECSPNCAEIVRLGLQLDESTLQAVLEIHAQAPTAVPLPGNARHWLPQQVTVDGQAATGLLRSSKGDLWLPVDTGVHLVQIQGQLSGAGTIQLPFPLIPHRIEVKTDSWQVEGLRKDGQSEGQLQFNRIHLQGDMEEALEMTALPPFVQIERTLQLGLDWQVVTTIRRLTPAGTAVILEVPLLPGESITSERPRVEENRARVHLGPNQNQLSWVSVLSKQPQLTLTAEDSYAWSETWKLDAGPIWHVESEGIPVIHHQSRQGRWLPEWRPWPGEIVTLSISRTEGVEGRILTIDDSLLEVRPGQRSTESTLSLTLRSSRGGQTRLTLPDGASLQSVQIDGAAQPIRQEGNQVTLPLVPGSQQAVLLFRTPQSIGTRFTTETVNLQSPSVNARIALHPPANRWILMVGGPRMGPAVLFWGVLLIVIAAAVGLGRTRRTPLKTIHWILLGLVISQVSPPLLLIIVGWFFALAWRSRLDTEPLKPWQFNSVQILLGGLTLATLALLVFAIEQGLLGHPNMMILGNGSNRYALNWYQDQVDGTLPSGWMISLPIMVYRIAMLVWALWLSFALLKWLRWGWDCFSSGRLWKAAQIKKNPPKAKSEPSEFDPSGN
jgi:hypothetical protein